MSKKDQITRTAVAAGAWWADRLGERFTQHRAAFIGAVAGRVEEALKRDAWIELECDYEPVGELLAAVREAGIDARGTAFEGILPWKHSLSVEIGRLEPKEGYGNWTDVIEVL